VKLGANSPCWCGSGEKYKRCHRATDGALRPGRLSPTRPVPPAIARPEYVANEGGEPASERGEVVQPAETIERMRRTGAAAAEVLALVGEAIEPGMTTDDLDAIAHQAAVERDAYPSPLGYRGYPKSVCTSINEVICHGIPDDRQLNEGDIVNIDVTLFREGVHGDTNATFAVGEIDPESRRLIEVTRRCMLDGIAAVSHGRPISEIGRAIEARAHEEGFGVVREFVGHAVGPQFHGALQIPHYHEPRANTVMVAGMTFTVEPMISYGSPRVRMWDDGWTALTVDGLRTAQFEHTLLVAEAGAEILTAQPGSPDFTLDPTHSLARSPSAAPGPPPRDRQPG
jgi:methionyl aminopeptidase